MSINNKEKNFVFQVKTKRFYQTITSFKLVKKYSRDNITNLIISNQYLIYIYPYLELAIFFPLPWREWQSRGKARLHSTPSRCGRETAPPLWDQILTLQSACCRKGTNIKLIYETLKRFVGFWDQWDWCLNCICHVRLVKITFAIGQKSIKYIKEKSDPVYLETLPCFVPPWKAR